MFKIKLLILLLFSLIFYSCSTSNQSNLNKFDLNYIGGKEDGLQLKNLLTSYFKSMKMFDENSDLKLSANINHEQRLYITNSNNTSNREQVVSTIDVSIFDKQKNCKVYEKNNLVSQYYVFASTIKFTSNNKAIDRIKYNNAEILVIDLARELINEPLDCLDEK